MPRLGGLAVILGFLVSVIYLIIVMVIEKNLNLQADNLYIKLLGFLAGGIVIGLTCFYDDVKGAKAIVKLCAQVIAAIIVVCCGIKIDRIDIAFIDNLFPSWVYNVITVFWIVGITNALNLIDGLDGLSTGISIISCISLLMIFSLNGSPLISIILITALCGSLVGFLPYNFNPAKTFIGDTGSNFLGYSLAIISILGVAKTYTAIVIVAPLIVLALPLFDTVFAIFRRLKNGKSLKAIIQPDAGHLHHKMLKRGFTQKQAVLILYTLSATLGMFAVILLDSGIWKALSFLLIIVVIVALGYKEFFKQRLLTSSSEEIDEDNNIDGQESIEDIEIKKEE
jgi:UDP-GlcNAc:undecaprenyl-phosphate GlcNAc-1-phosphate transferase